MLRPKWRLSSKWMLDLKRELADLLLQKIRVLPLKMTEYWIFKFFTSEDEVKIEAGVKIEDRS